MTTERIPTSTNEAILTFYLALLSSPSEVKLFTLEEGVRLFTLEELFTYVEQFGFGTSRETIKRSLRNLRQAGKVNYTIHNRNLGTLKAQPLAAVTVEATQQV